MTESDLDTSDLEAAAAGVLALAEYGIPVDIQELLIRGDPVRGIRRGALAAAVKATVISYKRHDEMIRAGCAVGNEFPNGYEK